MLYDKIKFNKAIIITSSNQNTVAKNTFGTALAL